MKFGETFLHYPDLFPARRGGEPWGEQTVTLDFVGGPYRFTCLSTAQAAAIEQRFSDLVASDVEPAVEASCLRVAIKEFRPVPLAGWSYTFDRDYRPHAVRLAGLEFMAMIDLEPTLTGAIWSPHDGDDSYMCQFENFFRVVVSYRLLALGGVLFHSAGIVSNELAYLFLGHSGAGKSTISRLGLASGRSVLSDDMNAMCPDVDGVMRVEKLPFAGDLGHVKTPQVSYPLAALCRLRQGQTALEPLSKAQSIGFLLTCAPFVNADEHRLEQLSQCLERLIEQFPPRQLTFSLDEDFWPLLEGATAEHSVEHTETTASEVLS